MSLSFLESFDGATSRRVPPERSHSAADLEAARQEGHAAGYSSGWEAATQTAAEDQTAIAAALATHVQELGFTYQEARAHVMKGIEPLLRQMVETVLPEVMVEALGHTIVAEVTPLAEEAANMPVHVAVAPGDAERLRIVLGENTPVPLRIVEDGALASGQADLRLGEVERMIDIAGVLSRISTAVRAVEELNQRTIAHA